ncbi:MAG: hypothetical protein JWQ30_1323 [Sediminibacterium sp.]|nr:hypothetical protein [Sediminibacterium sp.]
MASECRIEFYFRAEDLKKLLKANPKAKGIIVSQEIKKEKPKGAANYVNVAHIRARVDMIQPAKSAKSAKLMTGGEEPPPEEGIDGCPFPPGCTP